MGADMWPYEGKIDGRIVGSANFRDKAIRRVID